MNRTEAEMAMPDPGTARFSRPRAVVIAAVLLLHLALIAWLQLAWHRGQGHDEQRRSSVRMITIQLPPLPKPVVERRSPDRPAERRATRVQAPRPEVEIDPAAKQPSSTIVIAAPSPASAASGPSGRDLMYGAATQRAIRQGTQGQPLLSERADQASLAPDKIDASTRLGNEMMKGATGDCMKGEFAGGGAGLLSVPFWLLAEARGKCRR